MVNGAIFSDSANIGSGTGNYNTFLSIQDNNDDGFTEQGFNTDDSPTLDPSNTEISHSQTETVLLGAVPVSEVNGELFMEIRVDLNEPDSGNSGLISLDQFQVYVIADNTIIDLATLQSYVPVYDMDAGDWDNDTFADDVSVLLNADNSTGSGDDDYSILIPYSLFESFNPAFIYALENLAIVAPLDPFASEGGMMDAKGFIFEGDMAAAALA